MPFTVKIERRGADNRVVVSGDITELSDFEPTLKQLPEGPVAVDVQAVSRINSIGVRQWINFARAVAARGEGSTLVNCAPTFVHQLNMISDFHGGLKIASVQAPYFCPSCSTEHRELIALTPGKPAAVPQKVSCPKCKATMELDDVAESYFAFWSNR